MKKLTTKKMTMLALLTAMSVAVTLLIRFPLVPGVAFLKFDPKDIIIAIGGFLFGPLSALIVTLLSCLLENLFTGGTWVDIVMNIVSTTAFVSPAAWIYKKIHTKKGAITGLIAGTITCTLAMLLWNYAITPIYFGMPREAVIPMLPSIALFNFLKCSINTLITVLIYKPVVTALRRSGLVEENNEVTNTQAVTAVAVFMILTLLVVISSLKGII